MELNDTVSVILTEYGANFLNSKNQRIREENTHLRELFPEEMIEKFYPINYHKGSELQESLWIILNWFRTCFNIGGDIPFTNLHTV